MSSNSISIAFGCGGRVQANLIYINDPIYITFIHILYILIHNPVHKLVGVVVLPL